MDSARFNMVLTIRMPPVSSSSLLFLWSSNCTCWGKSKNTEFPFDPGARRRLALVRGDFGLMFTQSARRFFSETSIWMYKIWQQMNVPTNEPTEQQPSNRSLSALLGTGSLSPFAPNYGNDLGAAMWAWLTDRDPSRRRRMYYRIVQCSTRSTLYTFIPGTVNKARSVATCNCSSARKWPLWKWEVIRIQKLRQTSQLGFFFWIGFWCVGFEGYHLLQRLAATSPSLSPTPNIGLHLAAAFINGGWFRTVSTMVKVSSASISSLFTGRIVEIHVQALATRKNSAGKCARVDTSKSAQGMSLLLWLYAAATTSSYFVWGLGLLRSPLSTLSDLETYSLVVFIDASISSPSDSHFHFVGFLRYNSKRILAHTTPPTRLTVTVSKRPRRPSMSTHKAWTPSSWEIRNLPKSTMVPSVCTMTKPTTT